MPFSCTSTQNAANATIADSREPSRCYAPVDVTVTASSSGTIAISAMGTDGSLHTYTNLPWGNEAVMWAACPSTLSGDTNPNSIGPAPSVNATGSLLLSEAFINAVGIAGTPKWPTCLRSMTKFCAPLQVAASSLILSGTELADGIQNTGSVDLLDLACAPRQAIELKDGIVTVLLTPKGFAKMTASYPAEDFLAEDFLGEAVSTILHPKTARETAQAWGVVAAAIDRVECGCLDQEKATAMRVEIKRVLPDFKG